MSDRIAARIGIALSVVFIGVQVYFTFVDPVACSRFVYPICVAP